MPTAGKAELPMPLMSRKADYALLILSYLHRRPERGCARAIAITVVYVASSRTPRSSTARMTRPIRQ